VLCVASPSACTALRGSQESSTRRHRPPSVFLRVRHFVLANGPAGSLSSPRSLQRATSEQYKPRSFLSQAAVDNLLFCRNFSAKRPENLQELWPDQPSTALYTDDRSPPGGTRYWSRPTRQRDRALDGGRRKNCWK
jgi:hypothetical protein